MNLLIWTKDVWVRQVQKDRDRSLDDSSSRNNRDRCSLFFEKIDALVDERVRNRIHAYRYDDESA